MYLRSIAFGASNADKAKEIGRSRISHTAQLERASSTVLGERDKLLGQSSTVQKILSQPQNNSAIPVPPSSDHVVFSNYSHQAPSQQEVIEGLLAREKRKGNDGRARSPFNLDRVRTLESLTTSSAKPSAEVRTPRKKRTHEQEELPVASTSVQRTTEAPPPKRVKNRLETSWMWEKSSHVQKDEAARLVIVEGQDPKEVATQLKINASIVKNWFQARKK